MARAAKKPAPDPVLPDDEKELAALNEEMFALECMEARDSFNVYCGLMIPENVERDEDEDDRHLRGMEKLPMAARYVPAEHHRLLNWGLEGLERGYVVEGGKQIPFKRLMVFMPPGSAKSTYGSVLFPSWYLGKHPRDCVIQGSYNAELAGRFGRRARNAYASPEHQSVFPRPLGKSAESQWDTALGGEYFAFGMKTGVTGRRADGVIIDDAIKGRKEADSETERNNVWETYKADVRTRMKPGAWILYIGTRWHEDDPAGRILPESWKGQSGWVTARDGERWYVISLNAVIESEEEAANDPLGRDVGEILWPEWFTEDMLLQERRTQGARNWWALYKQMPRPDDGGILKRKFWRKWPGEKPPKCEFVLAVYDTAFEEGEENDYSARTTWGIFRHEEPPPAKKVSTDPLEKWRKPPKEGWRYCMILLDSFEEKVQFPELKKEVKDHWLRVKPDRILIEKKASGHSLLQELKRSHLPVTPVKAETSKLSRAHAAAPVLEDGVIFYMDRKWAEHVIERCATFPVGRYNDIGDTAVHAWLWMRQHYKIDLKGDDDDDDELPNPEDIRSARRSLFGR